MNKVSDTPGVDSCDTRERRRRKPTSERITPPPSNHRSERERERDRGRKEGRKEIKKERRTFKI